MVQLHKIFIEYNKDKKQRDMEENKLFSFFYIWRLFEDGDDESVNSVDNFILYLKEEAQAIKNAHYPEKGETHEDAYKRDSSQRKKFSDVAIDFFKAEDEYFKSHESSYIEYIQKLRELENLDEDEQENELSDLQNKHKDHIDAYNNCKNKYLEMERYERTINSLKELPKDVLKEIIKLMKECKERGCSDDFEKSMQEFFYYSRYMKQDEDNKINCHHLNIGNGNNAISHTIKNVSGSGLNISLVDNGMTIISCGENINKKELEALAEFSFMTDCKVNDFGDLKGTQVIDEKGEEIGVIEEEYDAAVGRYDQKEGENIDCELYTNNPTISAEESYFGCFIPKEKITEKTKPIKLFGKEVINIPTATGLDMEKVDAAIRKFAGNSFEILPSFNETVVKVYANKDDMYNGDNKYDDKGTIKHIKRFAVTFNHRKEQATFYLGPKEKMTTDIARVALDAYKAQGYKYFKIPSATDKKGFGKEGQAAFLKASVKTGMVMISNKYTSTDLEAILKASAEEESLIHNPGQKAEYFMRWHEQLEQYVKDNPKDEKELSTLVNKFKHQATFAHFEKTYKGLIEEKIGDSVENEGWDDVDLIAAQSAYIKIVNNIKSGYLAGKRYNPLDEKGNEELILKTFNKLRKVERENIKKEINASIEAYSKDTSIRDKNIKAIREVKDAHNMKYKGVVNELKAYGVNVEYENGSTSKRYVPEKDKKIEKDTGNVVHPKFLQKTR